MQITSCPERQVKSPLLELSFDRTPGRSVAGSEKHRAPPLEPWCRWPKRELGERRATSAVSDDPPSRLIEFGKHARTGEGARSFGLYFLGLHQPATGSAAPGGSPSQASPPPLPGMCWRRLQWVPTPRTAGSGLGKEARDGVPACEERDQHSPPRHKEHFRPSRANSLAADPPARIRLVQLGLFALGQADADRRLAGPEREDVELSLERACERVPESAKGSGTGRVGRELTEGCLKRSRGGPGGVRGELAVVEVASAWRGFGSVLPWTESCGRAGRADLKMTSELFCSSFRSSGAYAGRSE